MFFRIAGHFAQMLDAMGSGAARNLRQRASMARPHERIPREQVCEAMPSTFNGAHGSGGLLCHVIGALSLSQPGRAREYSTSLLMLQGNFLLPF